MNAAARTSTVRLFVAVTGLFAALLGLLCAMLRLGAELLTQLTDVIRAAGAGRRRAAASQPAAAAATSRPTTIPFGVSLPQMAAGPAVAAAPPPFAFYAGPPEPMGEPATQPTPAPRPVAVSKYRCQTFAAIAAMPPLPASPFELPSAEHLTRGKAAPTEIDTQAQQQCAKQIVEALGSYGVQGSVENVVSGPTVTTYEVAPAAGTKVSKVAGLADDMSMALGRKVRIVAPIPGTSRIGVELPATKRAEVNLRDLIEDPRFAAFDAALPVVLGRDALGAPVYADLAAMPHAIVAGATGAGKSVGLNVLLLSLLYRMTPADLRLLLIDPKVVELAPFNRIPHMLQPVVTDMAQAAVALQWAVTEMERRYQLFADAGTKSVSSYNAWVERIAKDQTFVGARPQKLPYIVIVVDEFADLIQQRGGEEVEAAVARLAQKARASGMHVILATQRPSVEVITGDIKANFPTRIAFRVAQKNDSRVVLDEQGAEQLLGSGDMLVKLNGSGDPQRVQCPWVSEDDVSRVTGYLRTQGAPIYDQAVLQASEPAATTNNRAALRVVAGGRQ